MGNSKTKKIIFTVLAFISLASMAVMSFATDANGQVVVVNPNAVNTATTNGTTNTATNVVPNVVANTQNTNLNTVRSNTANNSTYQNTTLPKTGSNDFAVIGLAIVCGISAIYAYKKIKDYNMK